jgi:hypothetical protein
MSYFLSSSFTEESVVWGSMESAFRLQPRVVWVGHCAGSVSSPEVGMDVIDFGLIDK